jgi:hypothetical protein
VEVVLEGRAAHAGRELADGSTYLYGTNGTGEGLFVALTEERDGRVA